MVFPSLRTVMLCAILMTSWSLCEIIIRQSMLPVERLQSSRRWSESSSFRAAVGSSSMRSSQFFASACYLLTSCCFPTLMFLTCVVCLSLRPIFSSARQLPVGFAPVYDAVFGSFISQENILRNRHKRIEGKLLVDYRDPRRLAVTYAPESAFSPLNIIPPVYVP